MVDLLDVLLNIFFELLPAIVEVLTDIPGTSVTTTQQTDKPNTSCKRA